MPVNCDDYRAGMLAGRTGPEMDEHRSTCASCRARTGGLVSAREILSEPSTWAEPPPELREQVVGLISGSPAGQSPGPKPWPWLVAAAAAALAVVIGAALWARPPTPDWVAAVHAVGSEVPAGSVSGWNTSSGTRMQLHAPALAAAPPGFVYEMWLSKGTVYVSAGTFAGGGDVALWVGVRRADYPRIWVTLEPLDGNPAPSGITVFDSGA